MFDNLPEEEDDKEHKKGATIVMSGDGRYYHQEAFQVRPWSHVELHGGCFGRSC